MFPIALEWTGGYHDESQMFIRTGLENTYVQRVVHAALLNRGKKAVHAVKRSALFYS